MLLSVVIVNYNVKHFLEQCLHAVARAAAAQPTEIIVVDNASTDGSLAYLQPRFPQVRFLCNNSNNGFGKACNLGLAAASGQYILFLNPDTLVPENAFADCLRFFQSQPACGALGVKMVDGSGRFLKESKRAFPSPLTSFFKLTGLARLFPGSRLFGRYHLGHLPQHQPHEVDVLAGAFFFTTKAVLQKVGAFDEDFFMYGEDVDLSYRIQQAGYRNHYFPGVTIIHFKGESTKRGSLNYVRMFYQAMGVFVKKHYGGAKASLFRVAILLAIWLRALLAAVLKLVRWMGLPVMDAAVLLGSFWIVKAIWEGVRKDTVYPDRLVLLSLPAFALLYLISAYYAGLYDRQYKPGRVWRAGVVATVTLLAVYSLLPETLRFSRAIVLLGAALGLALLWLLRWLLYKAGVLTQPTTTVRKPQLLVAASAAEYEAVVAFLNERGWANRLIGRVGTNGADDAVTHISQLASTAQPLQAKELLLCAGNLSYAAIISLVERLPNRLRFRFHAVGSGSLVGSDSSTASGEVLSTETDFALAQPGARRLKRLIDVATAVAFLLTFPVHLLLAKKPLAFFANAVAVLCGRKTWVGYTAAQPTLPPLRPGVLSAAAQPLAATDSPSPLDYWYARNYEPQQDLRTIFLGYRRLGG